MPEGHQLLLFVAAGVLLNLTPGVDVFFIVSSSLRQGVRAGLAAALGITLGCCVHIAAAAFGLGALVAASAEAFAVLKWVGAAYLVYIGVTMLLARDAGGTMAMSRAGDVSSNDEAASGGAGRLTEGELLAVVRRGFLTNVLNPKVALFFLAFVPQFIAADTPHPTLVFVALGLLFNFNALWVNFGWALAAAWMARRIGAASRAMRWSERAAGLLIVGFGLKLALSDAPSAPVASR